MINRTTLVRGPGSITFDGASIHSETNIVATLVEEYSDSVSSGFGRTGRKLLNRYVEVTAQPSMWLNLDKLFPYAATQIEDAIFGATDKPLVITPRNGRTLTVLNASITTLANLKCSAAAALFKSPITWTGLCANNTSPATLANYFVQGGTVGAGVLLTGFDKTKMFRGRYTGVRNGVTLQSDGGFDIDFALNLEAYRPDGEPTVQFYLKSLEAAVKCRPAGLTEAAYLALLNDGVDIGAEAPLHDIVVAGPSTGSPSITLAKTMVEPGSFVYGGELRTGELTFQSVREPATNVLPALWTIGVVPTP
jgi:hypothetical protein